MFLQGTCAMAGERSVTNITVMVNQVVDASGSFWVSPRADPRE
jgi:hypothetical protein